MALWCARCGARLADGAGTCAVCEPSDPGGLADDGPIPEGPGTGPPPVAHGNGPGTRVVVAFHDELDAPRPWPAGTPSSHDEPQGHMAGTAGAAKATRAKDAAEARAPAASSAGSGGGREPDACSGDGSGSDRPWPWVVAALGLLIALIASVAAVLVVRSDRRSPTTIRVTLSALDEVTAHPFTKSVVTVDPGTARAYAAKVRHRQEGRPGTGATASRPTGSSEPVRTVELSGDRPGLYGTRRDSVCDTAMLTAALAADRRVAAVWARLMRIAPSDIGPTVAALIPVVLSHDTAVTNHIYRDGRGTALQDILEAGTAVLVDAHGVPRVKCACGNPLLPPRTGGQHVEVVGDPWNGYDASRVVTVTPTPQRVTAIDATDISTGAITTVAAGGNEALEGLLLVDHRGVHVVSEDGTERRTVIDHEVARAFDDGAGGLIYNELGPPDDRGRPADPTVEVERNQAQATIWHLPPGATRPQPLIEPGPEAGAWAVAEATGTLAGDRVLVYQALHVAPCLGGEDSCAVGDIRLRNLDTGKDTVVHPEARRQGQGPESVSVGGGRLAYTLYSEGSGWSMQVRDARLREVPAPCQPGYDDPGSCPQYLALVSDPNTGRPWAFGMSPVYDGDNVSMLVDLGSDARIPTGERRLPPTMQGEAARHVNIDALSGRGLISIPPGDAASGSTVLIDLITGELSELPLMGTVRFLRAPLIRPPAPSPGPLPAPPTDPATLLKRFAAAWVKRDDEVLRQLAESDVLTTLGAYWGTRSSFQKSDAGLADCLTAQGCMVLQFPDGPGAAIIWQFFIERRDARLRITRVENRGSAH